MLQAELGKWAGWLASGTDDMANLVDEQLHNVADWESNFKALKVSLKWAWHAAGVISFFKAVVLV